jgi:hypothetical protein
MRASTASFAVSIRIGVAQPLSRRARHGDAVLLRQHHVEDDGVVDEIGDSVHSAVMFASVHWSRMNTMTSRATAVAVEEYLQR